MRHSHNLVRAALRICCLAVSASLILLGWSVSASASPENQSPAHQQMSHAVLNPAWCEDYKEGDVFTCNPGFPECYSGRDGDIIYADGSEWECWFDSRYDLWVWAQLFTKETGQTTGAYARSSALDENRIAGNSGG